jgi:hypothetical protein
MSTPRLIVLATIRMSTAPSAMGVGKPCLRTPARPRPVTMPILAQTYCTVAISGKVSGAVQSME